LPITGNDCAEAVDKALAVVRKKAQDVTDGYLDKVEQWGSKQEQYLEDLQKFLDGEIAVEPSSPGSPPDVPLAEKYPTPADYSKAFGDGFLKYICENVTINFTWDGKGTDVSSGATVSDPTYLTGFSVSGALGGVAGGGTLIGPGESDVSLIDTFLGNLSSLASKLVVTLPSVPGVTTFLPPTVTFNTDAQLFADPAFHVSSNPSYDEILLGVCTDLITSFKTSLEPNFESDTSCLHSVVAMPNVPAGFSGTVSMSSIS
jgi:hypothetical protein